MVKLIFDPPFEKEFRKIKNKSLKQIVIKQLKKIEENPSVGKPMRYARKGTRELRVPPFRLSYNYSEKKDEVFILNLYHKDEQ